MQPGRTDKHVLLIMPREAHENMVIQTDPTTGSIANIVVTNSLMGVSRHGLRENSDKALCLSHASKERMHLKAQMSSHLTVIYFQSLSLLPSSA